MASHHADHQRFFLTPTRTRTRTGTSLDADDPKLWHRVQAHHAVALAEAMLWAQGLILRRDEIGRDLMETRANSDPEAMQLARWALRRLRGRGIGCVANSSDTPG
ncbi:MAG: hypothetical protein FJX25_12945 [Alphaproteobacteria bacterium]|nr:hypothetical protein [Alphaproteobacteria bacterium]